MDRECAWCGECGSRPGRAPVVPTALGGTLAFHLPACASCRLALGARPVLALVGRVAYGLAWCAAPEGASPGVALRSLRALARGQTPSARVTGPIFDDEGEEEVAAVLHAEGGRLSVYVRLVRACFRVDADGDGTAWRHAAAVSCRRDAAGLGLQRGPAARLIARRVIPPGLAPPPGGGRAGRTARPPSPP